MDGGRFALFWMGGGTVGFLTLYGLFRLIETHPPIGAIATLLVVAGGFSACSLLRPR